MLREFREPKYYNLFDISPRDMDIIDNEIRNDLIREVLDRNCYNCGKKFEEKQRICEMCGIDLPRM